MKVSVLVPVFAAALLLAALFASPPDPEPNAPKDRVPVVVELFTSEGCSSCPPADKLLLRLADEQPVGGAEIIVLSEHVDYWNRLGWKDPFSHGRFSQRQQEYSRQRWPSKVYTPQMVVDGSVQFVGSDASAARDAITAAAKRPKAKVEIELGGQNLDTLPVSIRITRFPTGKGRAEVILAVTEDELSVDVSRGENGGRKLSHTGVVRDWRVVGSIDISKDTPFEASESVALSPDWNPGKLRIVALAQQVPMGKIIGAASIEPRMHADSRR
jgi:hypothetical protein